MRAGCRCGTLRSMAVRVSIAERHAALRMARRTVVPAGIALGLLAEWVALRRPDFAQPASAAELRLAAADLVVGLVLDILRTLGAEVDRQGEAEGRAAPDVAHDSPRTAVDDVELEEARAGGGDT